MSKQAVPVIDIGDLTESNLPDPVVQAVADAAQRYGFFQVVNHGISQDTLAEVWRQTRAFFHQPIETKRRIMRTKDNTRGYYDRELTKNARDLKEVLDIAHVPFPDLPPDDPRTHHAVDGRNQWPDLAGFEDTLIGYLQACEQVSLRLLNAFSAGLGEPADRLHQHFVDDHTSFVRLNHYPLADLLSEDEAGEVTALGDMALHHHSDAGALTLLLQDDVGGLQVNLDEDWVDVEPIDDALVVNTGDMMQVWSNDRYQAALHRVRPVTDRPRLSLPYFFNPSYSTDYEPLAGSVDKGDSPHYRSINWGQFRQARADGDYADYGAEVQISNFRVV